MKNLKVFALYLGVATLGIGLSFFISIELFPIAMSQEPPSPADMPAAGNTGTAAAAQVQAPAQATAETPAAEQTQVSEPSTDEVMARLNSESYTYDATGKRDPFKVYEGFLRAEKKAALNPNRPKNPDELPEDPLQRSDVSAFTVVGILWDVKNPRALVKDGKEGIYTVTRNTKIGLNDGYVAMIREGEIVVVETFHEDGQPRKQTKVLALGR